MRKPVALITGSAGGLGSGLTRGLLARGWKVLAHVRISGQADHLARDGAQVISADLSSAAELSALIEKATNMTGQIDALVNNAALGYGPPGSTRQLTPENLESRLAVNVLAPLAIMNGFSKHLSTGSKIINIASTNQALVDSHDLQLSRNWTRANSYRQTKALNLISTEVYARKWEPRGIRVNAIHPGTRLPTKIVLESGVKPIGSLELGVRTCMKHATEPNASTGMFLRAGEDAVPLNDLYADHAMNDELVTRLRGLIS